MKVDDIMDVALRRGFIFPASEIYGGVSGFWEYGHLGTKLRQNWENAWRRHFLGLDPNYHEITTTNIMPKGVFEGSGHLENFNDPLTSCTRCNQRFRADDLVQEATGRSVEDLTPLELSEAIRAEGITCPKCKGELGEVNLFNMMFQVNIGAAGGLTGYLRPETAQGSFVSFKRMFEVLRNKLPMGLAIVGRVYRNEISPRQGFFRLREFNQAELQIFFDPDAFEEHPDFETVRDTVLRVKQFGSDDIVSLTCGELVESRGIGKFYVYHMARVQEFYLTTLRIPPELFRFRELGGKEKAFYNKVHWDVEVYMETLGGFKEVGGIHYRTDHDLGGHEKASKQRLQVNIDGKKFVPHVLELSFGVDRNFWALMDVFYEQEGERTVFHFPPALAPVTVAVFPLLNKPELIAAAEALYTRLSPHFSSDYDRGGSIGRRYRRHDEVGTPYCLTVDFDTVEKGTVTLRDRDSMGQDAVALDTVAATLMARLCP